MSESLSNLDDLHELTCMRIAITVEDVAQCYMVFLGREAENEQVLRDKNGQLRGEVLESFLALGTGTTICSGLRRRPLIGLGQSTF